MHQQQAEICSLFAFGFDFAMKTSKSVSTVYVELMNVYIYFSCRHSFLQLLSIAIGSEVYGLRYNILVRFWSQI